MTAAQLSLPPSQRARCSDCGSASTALVHHTHRMVLVKTTRLIEWDECFDCCAREDARSKQLQKEAEEDRKLREPPRARRQSNSLSFIAQIDGGED